MTLAAVRKIPYTNRVYAAKVFEGFIHDYESGSGDKDPYAYFLDRNKEIAERLSQEDTKPYISAPCPGRAAYDYYMQK
jgi:hypothetical protein